MGYIVFCRISGSPPFWHRRQVIMLRMIMEGNYSFSSPEWDEISENVKDLVIFFHSINIFPQFYFFKYVFLVQIKNLLVVDTKKRFTAEQALNSPFFQREVNIFWGIFAYMTRLFKSNANFQLKVS